MYSINQYVTDHVLVLEFISPYSMNYQHKKIFHELKKSSKMEKDKN